jgi:hypothetical protein
LGSPLKKPSGPYADKLWREALRRAVLKRVEGEQRLDLIAERVVAQALDGDDKAYKEVGDRLDGKAAQALEHSGPDGEPLVVTWLQPTP